MDYIKELDELRERKADFVTYYNYIVDSMKEIDHPAHITGFLYMALNDVRNLGVQEGIDQLKKDIENL